MPTSDDLRAVKLTKAQRKALEWLRDNGPVSLIPIGGPSFAMLRRCKVRGFVDDSGREPGHVFRLTVFALTDAGRRALAAAENGR